MVVQILSNTPAWVFVLFFVLLAFGLMQTSTRTVGRIPVLLFQTTLRRHAGATSERLTDAS